MTKKERLAKIHEWLGDSSTTLFCICYTSICKDTISDDYIVTFYFGENGISTEYLSKLPSPHITAIYHDLKKDFE